MLDQHRTADGAAILPGTGYLELVAEAVRALDEDRAYEIRDVMFLRAFHAEDRKSRNLRLKMRATDYGYDFEIQGDYRDGFVTHAEGRISMVALPAASEFEARAVAKRCGPKRMAEDGQHMVTLQEAHLKFGPEWQALRAQALGEGEGLAQLELAASVDGVTLHPGLLDIGTGWAMALIDGYTAEHLWVPVSYGALRHYGTLPRRVQSWVRGVRGSAKEGTASFDVILADIDGNVCVEVDGLTLKRLENGFAASAAQAPSEAEIERDTDSSTHHPLSPNELRLQHNLSQGIPAAQGGEALRRALACDLPQVIVSSLDLEALISQVSEDTQEAEDESKGFERPDLDTDYVAPRNDIERTLAGFWQELLGIEQVGIEDSFFDLGGHSLIAVRLFSMVKKAYRTEFPISVLFEAPTIAKCAALIEERIGPDAATEGGEAAGETVVTPERRYAHLVPMHQSAGSSKTPFFLVAGMYGNVLNLRHLAHLIGADRPFYGFRPVGCSVTWPRTTIWSRRRRIILPKCGRCSHKGPICWAGSRVLVSRLTKLRVS